MGNIINVPINQPLLPILAKKLWQMSQNDPQKLKEYTIYLPTKNASYRLGEILLKESKCSAIILPQIIAIGDFAEISGTLDSGDNDNLIPTPEGLKFALLLNLLVSNGLPLKHSLNLGYHLLDCINNFIKYEVTFDEDIKKKLLQNYELISFKGNVINLIISVYEIWDEYLTQLGFIDCIRRQINNIYHRADNLNPKTIIAASTGSLNAVRFLMKKILDLDEGYVVLWGAENYDQESFYEASPLNLFKQIMAELNHPINRSLQKLACDRQMLEAPHHRTGAYPSVREDSRSGVTTQLSSEVEFPERSIETWGETQENLATKLLSSFRGIPEKWQPHQIECPLPYIKNEVTLVEAQTLAEEAKVIAYTIYGLKLNITDDIRIGIICNDHKLLAYLEKELNNLNVDFINYIAINLNQIDFFKALMLLAKIYNKNFVLLEMLSLFKLLLSEESKLMDDFEISYLRHDKLKITDFNEFLALVKNVTRESLYAQSRLALIEDHLNIEPEDYQDFFGSHLSLAQKLFPHLYEEVKNNDALSTALREVGNNFMLQKYEVSKENFSDLLKYAIARTKCFNKGAILDGFKVMIATQMEIKLQDFDWVFISSLNKGSCPREIEINPFLTNNLANALKLDVYEKHIMLANLDLCQLMSAPHIVLSRSVKMGETLAEKSPLWSRIESMILDNQYIISGATVINNFDIKIENPIVDSKKFVPPIDVRPNNFSIRDIFKLINNPYYVYAKNILNLVPMEEIKLQELDDSTYGLIVHQFIKNYMELKLHEKKSDDFRYLLAKVLQDKMQDSLIKAFWIPKLKVLYNWLETNFMDVFKYNKIHIEPKGEVKIGKSVISGKADLIVGDEKNGWHIIDYKMNVPTFKDVRDFNYPNMFLVCAILMNNGFPGINGGKINSCSFLHINKDKIENHTMYIKDYNEYVNDGIKMLITLLNNYRGEVGIFEYNEKAKDEYYTLARVAEREIL